MESNKAPVHDFAPAWLKIPDTQKTNKLTNITVSTSTTQDNYSFRPKYLDNDLKVKHNLNINNNNNNNKISVDTIGVGECNEQIINDTQYNNNKQINGGNNINERRFYKSKSDINRRPHSRHDFRDVTSFHHSKSGNIDYGNHTNISAATPSASTLSSLSNTVAQISTATSTSTVTTTATPSATASTTTTKQSILSNKDTINKLSKVKKPVIIDSNTEFPSLINENLKTNDNEHNKINVSIWNNAKNIVLKSGTRSYTILQKQNTYNQLSTDYTINNDNCSSLVSSTHTNSQCPLSLTQQQQRSLVDNGSSYYHQSLVSKRRTFKDNTCKDNNNTFISNVNKNNKWLPLISGANVAEQTLSTMELLVRNPKIRSNKSEFLRALRAESNLKNDQNKNNQQTDNVNCNNKRTQENIENERDNNNTCNNETETVNTCINNNNHTNNNNSTSNNNNNNNNNNQVKQRDENNGINISKLMITESSTGDTCKNGGCQLSSSLEAEERLLKEMGWKEIDDDDNFCAPLTEDEVKEFRDLIMSRNGFEKKYKTQHLYQNNNNCNNHVINRNQHNNQFNWSPMRNLNRVNGFISSPEIMDEDSSSTSSDDDEEDDEDDNNLKMIV